MNASIFVTGSKTRGEYAYQGAVVMEWNDVDFCHNTNFITRRWAAHLIAEGIFGANPAAQISDLFLGRYEQMAANFKGVSCLTPNGEASIEWSLSGYVDCINASNRRKPDARLKVPLRYFSGCSRILPDVSGYENVGHDLPAWMCKRDVNPRKKVMIVSIDPKRTGDASGAVYLGTPFGFHCMDYRAKTEDDIISRITKVLLEQDNFVYLTDAKKLYATSCGRKVAFSALRSVFGDVLNAEIIGLNPDLILTLGNDALDKRKVVSMLNRAHLPRYGACIQRDVIAGLQVVAAYHPNPQFSRRRDRNYCGIGNIDAYFELILTRIEEALR